MGKKAIVVSLFLSLVTTSLWAGGWNNTLMGCRAIALGGAFVGVADDPSAVFYNPAGLSFQKENLNFSVNGFYVWPTYEFSLPAGPAVKSKYNTAIPQIFFTYRTNDKLTIGFGAYAPYATGGVDWKKGQLAVPLKTYLGIFSLSPTIAYQVSQKLSIGFTLNFFKGIFEVNTEVDPFGPLDVEENGSAFSAGFGLMYKPNEKMGLGLSIRGPGRMKLSGKTAITTAVPGLGLLKIKYDSETSFSLPWDVEIGFSYRVADNFLVSTSAQYTMWSSLDKVEKTIKNLPFVGDIKLDETMDFNNILILRVGAEYLFPGGLALRAGIGLDRAASPSESLRIDNIDVDKLTLLGGIGYSTGCMRIDFVCVYAQGKERERKIAGFGFPLIQRFNLNVVALGLGVTFSF